MSKESSARQNTRTRILDATERLLETTSSQNFKVADIASEAGVSPSLVIQYFNTKDELVFEASLRRMMRLSPETFGRFADPQGDHTLWEFFDFSLKRDIGFAHVTADVMSLSWRWSPDDEVNFTAAMQPRREALAILLAREVGREVPDDSLGVAETLYAGILRWAIIHRSGPEEAMRKLRARMELVLRGLRA